MKALTAGDVVTADAVRSVRPGYGLAPKLFDRFIGKTVKQDIECGTATSWDLVD